MTDYRTAPHSHFDLPRTNYKYHYLNHATEVVRQRDGNLDEVAKSKWHADTYLQEANDELLNNQLLHNDTLPMDVILDLIGWKNHRFGEERLKAKVFSCLKTFNPLPNDNEVDMGVKMINFIRNFLLICGANKANQESSLHHLQLLLNNNTTARMQEWERRDQVTVTLLIYICRLFEAIILYSLHQ